MPLPGLLPNAEQEYARLDALLEAVPLAVAVFDGQLVLAATNARYRDLTGLDVAQAIGRSIYYAFPNALADLTEQVDIAAGGVPVVSVRVPFEAPYQKAWDAEPQFIRQMLEPPPAT